MDQLRWSLCPDARRRLVAANSGFDAESRWAELELWVGLALMADRLSAPAKVCRAELADVVRAAEQLDAGLAGLHAPTCNALWTTLHRAGKLTQAGSWFAQVRQDLGVLASVARAARDAIPGHGGRPPSSSRTPRSSARAPGSSAWPRAATAPACGSRSRAMPTRTSSTSRLRRRKTNSRSAA
jgi:hypothetical protein